jgi:hypothetical protein
MLHLLVQLQRLRGLVLNNSIWIWDLAVANRKAADYFGQASRRY